jgi:hypothetical protein
LTCHDSSPHGAQHLASKDAKVRRFLSPTKV